MTKKLKIGILGCGPRGKQMGHIVKLVPDMCELTAMSDPDPEHLNAVSGLFPGTALFESSDALIESGTVDSIIVETPPAVHAEYLVKALDRGINTLGEIPAVNSIEEGELLWRKVNGAKALYMCGSNPNYRAKTGFLLKLNELGLLGSVAYIETEYIHDLRDSKDKWRANYETCRYCTHSLGPVLALLSDDEIVSVSCMSTGDHFNCGFSHNAMSALFRTKNNVVIRFLIAFALPYAGPAHTTKLYAEKGVVELRNEKARVYLTDFNRFTCGKDYVEFPFTPKGWDFPQTLEIRDEERFRKASWGHNGSDILMLRDFADAVLNGKETPIGIRRALAMTLPGIYAAQSAREGGVLKEVRYPWSE